MASSTGEDERLRCSSSGDTTDSGVGVAGELKVQLFGGRWRQHEAVFMHRASHFYAWLPVSTMAGSAKEQGTGAAVQAGAAEVETIANAQVMRDNDAAALGRGDAGVAVGDSWTLELRQAHLDKLSRRLRGGSQGEVVLAVRLG